MDFIPVKRSHASVMHFSAQESKESKEPPKKETPQKEVRHTVRAEGGAPSSILVPSSVPFYSHGSPSKKDTCVMTKVVPGASRIDTFL